MTQLRFSHLIAVLVGVALTSCCDFAQAAFVLGGHTVFGGPDNGFPPPESEADGLVNFAVYERDTASWYTELSAIRGIDGTDLILYSVGPSPAPAPPLTAVPIGGYGSIDYGARYVYMYQVVNSNPFGTTAADASLNSLTITFPVSSSVIITSVGFLEDVVFEDPVGVLVGPSSNQKLGPVPDGTNPDPPGPSQGDTPGDDLPTYAQSFADIISLDPSAPAPAGLLPTITATIFPNSLRFTLGTTELITGGYTPVMFFTTNVPILDWSVANLTDTTATFGDLPVPSPEPASAVMALAACLIGVALLTGAKLKATRNA